LKVNCGKRIAQAVVLNAPQTTICSVIATSGFIKKYVKFLYKKNRELHSTATPCQLNDLVTP
jgi:hypothetical protein